MTSTESAFVEEMGQFLASIGMTPMAGRMWGWLLICEPEEQTAGEIADALQASRGAISGTARLKEFHDVMTFVEVEVPAMIRTFLRDRATDAVVVAEYAAGRES